MISVFADAQSKIEQMIRAAFAAAAERGELPDAAPAEFVVEVPADTAKGDFATNAAMVNAKAMHMAPAKIAAVLSAHFVTEAAEVLRVEVAGPGFINFFMQPQWFGRIIGEIAEKGEAFGRSDYGKGQKVMVEYVSANPTGPMHMGNARGGAIGDVLAEALAWSGHDTTREFYVNDAGNQIEKFGMSLEVRYLQHFKGIDAVVLPEDAYQGGDIIDHAEAFIKIHGDKYLECDSRTRKDALIGYALPINIANLKRDLGRYRINYDVWFHESTLYPDGVKNVLELLSQHGKTYESEGA
ncbi:MAG: arginine--tRNA ligase, partial [Angelakisella sp.]